MRVITLLALTGLISLFFIGIIFSNSKCQSVFSQVENLHLSMEKNKLRFIKLHEEIFDKVDPDEIEVRLKESFSNNGNLLLPAVFFTELGGFYMNKLIGGGAIENINIIKFLARSGVDIYEPDNFGFRPIVKLVGLNDESILTEIEKANIIMPEEIEWYSQYQNCIRSYKVKVWLYENLGLL